jgi:hypothetical protein
VRVDIFFILTFTFSFAIEIENIPKEILLDVKRINQTTIALLKTIWRVLVNIIPLGSGPRYLTNKKKQL